MLDIGKLTKNAAVVLVAVTCLLAATAPDAAATDDPRAPNAPDPSDASVFRGEGFDTCTAPALGTMEAWRGTSPYSAVGIYIGGRARACSQERLTRGWVASTHAMGWQLLPLYVGSQAPCVLSETKQDYSIDTDYPRENGTEEGRDAVQQARALGIVERSPIYLDMEAYDLYDTECLDEVLAYVQGWSEEVRREGYFAGFYSSVNYGVRHLAEARRAGERDLPDIIWFGRWDVPADLDDPALSPDDWQPHRRIHQYQGDAEETYGGETLSVDSNLIDAPVAVIANVPRPASGTPAWTPGTPAWTPGTPAWTPGTPAPTPGVPPGGPRPRPHPKPAPAPGSAPGAPASPSG